MPRIIMRVILKKAFESRGTLKEQFPKITTYPLDFQEQLKKQWATEADRINLCTVMQKQGLEGQLFWTDHKGPPQIIQNDI